MMLAIMSDWNERIREIKKVLGCDECSGHFAGFHVRKKQVIRKVFIARANFKMMDAMKDEP